MGRRAVLGNKMRALSQCRAHALNCGALSCAIGSADCQHRRLGWIDRGIPSQAVSVCRACEHKIGLSKRTCHQSERIRRARKDNTRTSDTVAEGASRTAGHNKSRAGKRNREKGLGESVNAIASFADPQSHARPAQGLADTPVPLADLIEPTVLDSPLLVELRQAAARSGGRHADSAQHGRLIRAANKYCRGANPRRRRQQLVGKRASRAVPGPTVQSLQHRSHNGEYPKGKSLGSGDAIGRQSPLVALSPHLIGEGPSNGPVKKKRPCHVVSDDSVAKWDCPTTQRGPMLEADHHGGPFPRIASRGHATLSIHISSQDLDAGLREAGPPIGELNGGLIADIIHRLDRRVAERGAVLRRGLRQLVATAFQHAMVVGNEQGAANEPQGGPSILATRPCHGSLCLPLLHQEGAVNALTAYDNVKVCAGRLAGLVSRS